VNRKHIKLTYLLMASEPTRARHAWVNITDIKRVLPLTEHLRTS